MFLRVKECVKITALVKIKTCSLVPKYQAQRVIRCKWAFQIKHKQDGSIDRYKGKLVAKGFHQWPDVDITYTFSLVVKPPTIHLQLTFVMYFNWPLY